MATAEGVCHQRIQYTPSRIVGKYKLVNNLRRGKRLGEKPPMLFVGRHVIRRRLLLRAPLQRAQLFADTPETGNVTVTIYANPVLKLYL
jgi:hypothetical protein